MIIGINYANERFAKAQKLNTWSMIHKGLVDKVVEYNPGMIDEEFQKKNAEILSFQRGAGYWIWKPYIIRKTLDQMESGDYLIYLDSGSVMLSPVLNLINDMELSRQDIMCFSLTMPEKKWSKRDAFVVMDCDTPEFADSPQRLATYMIIKKTEESIKLINEYLCYCTDFRIVTDEPNTLGLDNYEGFVENRHDQTVWSLLTKKHGILPFRDPSQYGYGRNEVSFPEDIRNRSRYGMVIDSHRKGYLSNWRQYVLYRHVIHPLGMVYRHIFNRVK